ncbi:Protein kinase, putative [Hondaea fermentalgiana]|uniref:Protein kinase, putative n=1 Tax=Hondaea fermentalgiana TaxID=2315210 RepID=A0A2R5GBD2_9STRA|nr:Protein kinase, putative [Hondaea fermentalgiana]|eukprot:GBG25883.1 Protein kinase, putative [Hondaea fermentalgiana]
MKALASASAAKQKAKKRENRTIGHYIIGETLGEGTFGKVRRGMHTLTGETVAVKVLEKSKIRTEGDLTRVTREIKILKKTRHGNCLRLLEVIDTPKQIFLMMEFLNGGELFDYIVEKHRLTEQEACEIFSQVLDGVQYLHEHNVIHRDLKPENLLLQRHNDGSFLIKVADFGLSNTNEGSKLLGTACGSPCYAAPEMIAGKKYDGTKSDIWSLGVVLFALVAGYLPFEDNDTPKLYRKILHANYKCPSHISAEVKDLLSKILEVQPKKRITIEGIRKHLWMRRHMGLSRMRDNQSFRSFMSLQSLEEEQDPTDGTVEVDERIMNELIGYGLDRNYICESILRQKHNSATASYFLVTERFRRLEQRGVQLKPRRMRSFPTGPGQPSDTASSQHNGKEASQLQEEEQKAQEDGSRSAVGSHAEPSPGLSRNNGDHPPPRQIPNRCRQSSTSSKDDPPARDPTSVSALDESKLTSMLRKTKLKPEPPKKPEGQTTSTSKNGRPALKLTPVSPPQ